MRRSSKIMLDITGCIWSVAVAALVPGGVAMAAATATVAAPASSTSGQPIQVRKVTKVVHPEKAVSTVSKHKVEHASPSSNMLSLLRDIPGFNVLSNSPTNLTASDNVFTLDGFTSNQVGATYFGVPIINLGRGGVYGQGDDHAITPLTLHQISTIKVYSGSNTPSENSVSSLGGTLNYVPKLPSKQSGVTVDLSGSGYKGHGNVAGFGVAANSGAVGWLDGFRGLASFHHTRDQSYQKNVHAILNSSYIALQQPYNNGLSKLTLIITNNEESGQFPDLLPQPLLDKFGYNYNYPRAVASNTNQTRATNVIIGNKSYLNPFAEYDFKFFLNDNRNDRTGYANPIYNNNYLGYRLPTYLKSSAALDGYGSNYNVYNAKLADQLFGSSLAGTQYQRYLDNYGAVGGKGSLSLLVPSNTIEIGGMVERFWDRSAEFWYGSYPVPMTIGYNDAWFEHDTVFRADGYIQDNASMMGGRLHFFPGVKYIRSRISAADSQGYYYGYAGSVGKTYNETEPSLGMTFAVTKSINVYANAGRTYKMPDTSAMYGLIGAGPIAPPVTVKPEYVNSLDSGIRFANDWGRVKLGVFVRQFKHIFSYFYNDTTGQTFEYNAGSASYKGFNIGFEKPFAHNFMAFLNYGYTNAKYTTNFTGNNGTVTDGMPRPDVPKYTANVGLEYANGPVFARVSDNVVGPQYLAYSSGVTSNTELPTYSLLNAQGAYTWHFHESMLRKLKLALFVDNILNKKHVTYGYINGSAGGTNNYQLSQPGAPLTIGLRVVGYF